MLAILWLIVWATVAEAFYDDHNWYTSDDGGTFESQKMARDNFTEILRSLVKSHKTPKREGNDELTMSKVKSRLRSLKLFQYTGSSDDFENNGPVPTLRDLKARHEFRPKYKMPLRFRLPPAKCYKKHEIYRIDWCNWCYCNDYFQRVCTDWTCPDHGGKPAPREKRKCIEGARYQRGKCKYCYCNVGSVMICNRRPNCTEKWWYLVRGKTPFQHQTPYVESTQSYVRHTMLQSDTTKKTITTTPRSTTTPASTTEKSFTPEKWFTPEKSFTPEESFTPKQWFTPDKLFTSEESFTPKKWFTPDKSFTPEKWFTPDKSFTPEKWFTPEKSFTPEKWFTPENSGEHWTEPIAIFNNMQKPTSTTRKPTTTKKKKSRWSFLRQRDSGEECVEGSYYEIDACNYCSCLNGREQCTNMPCSPSDQRSSFQKVYHDETLRQKQVDTKFMPKKVGLRFQLAPAKCLRQHEVYRIDWCNWCYCNDYFQRVCTDWTCGDHGGKPPPREKKKCIIGARYQRGKCKYCYCNIGHVMICNTRRNCTEKWWYLVNGTTEYQEQTPYPDPTFSRYPTGPVQTTTKAPTTKAPTTKAHTTRASTTKASTDTKPASHKHRWENFAVTKSTIKSRAMTSGLYLRNGERKCTEGDSYKIDSCNYCSCINGKEMCTKDLCSDNNLGTENSAESPLKASNIDTEFTSDKKDELHQQIKLAPDKCKREERYRIDWCNWCYCNNYSQRVCTDWPCDDESIPLPPERKKCIIGTRFERGDCKYCYCNYNRELICKTRNHCNKPWWYLVQGTTKWQPETSTPSNDQATLRGQLYLRPTTVKMKRHEPSTTMRPDDAENPKMVSPVRNIEKQCSEGSTYKIDSCNHCICLNGNEMCTNKSCHLNHWEYTHKNVENDDITGTNNLNTEFKANKESGLGFRIPTEKCLQRYEHFRIDWCNWCYCDENFQRVCTDRKCPDHGGLPHPPERKKCLPGTRFNRGRCKFCYCHSSKIIKCSIRKNCKIAWWDMANGILDKSNQTLPPIKRARTSNALTTIHYRLYDLLQDLKKERQVKYSEKQCDEGSSYKVDSCNYCVCLNGNEMCSNRPCPANGSQRVRYLRYDESQCAEGSYYKVDSCNYCFCVNGNEVCSSELCPVNDHVNDAVRSLPDISEDTGDNESDENKALSYKSDTQFVPDEYSRWRRFQPAPKICNRYKERYRIDNCNWCFCNEKHERVCTDLNCQGVIRPPKELKKCIVGARYERGTCKYCYCGIAYILICRTREFCDTRRGISTITKRSSLKLDCEMGIIERVDDCNYCLCNAEGVWKCTNMDCALQHAHGTLRISYHQNEDGTPRKCNIGEKYRLDACNYCYCNEKRERVCTDHACKHHDNVPASYTLSSAEEKDCKIGTRFRQGECNYCFCNNNHKLVCSVNRCFRRSSNSKLRNNKITIINL